MSRYVHSNPVRVRRMGIGKVDRQKVRVGASGAPEDRVLYLGRRACGLKLRELATAVGMADYSVVSIAISRH